MWLNCESLCSYRMMVTCHSKNTDVHALGSSVSEVLRHEIIRKLAANHRVHAQLADWGVWPDFFPEKLERISSWRVIFSLQGMLGMGWVWGWVHCNGIFPHLQWRQDVRIAPQAVETWERNKIFVLYCIVQLYLRQAAAVAHLGEKLALQRVSHIYLWVCREQHALHLPL